ncbi:WD40/YVTN/BNR-like repeat-containing protein [Flavobacterium humi]|uniref:Oxidoreductase n=1 Tax=Flavobacterium humi TaxID=2562683 RepID=A0A4Z0LCF4_9FLAO|nr:oxidoreductase [Flavobacterium humi]TGD59561.1 oxidoreductase [Flavobacterium humi]
MKKMVLTAIAISLLVSCGTNKAGIAAPMYSHIKIDTLFSGKLSCRALAVDGNTVWYAGNNGNYGRISLNGETDSNWNMSRENQKIEFRSMAQTSKYVFMLSIENPALLYRIAKDGSEIKQVYEEHHDKAFYDSMQFFNDTDGMAVGDPTEDCPSVIRTADGGATWQKIPCSKLPKLAEGEAFFAASNTNLILKGTKAWIVSGGKKARVFYSGDKGDTWTAYETPIIQGQTMTGTFTADFYNESIGILAGGNYEKPEQNYQNKAITLDGGKTWKLIADNQGFGYASCIQYFPGSGGKSIVSVGATGVFYSRDGGLAWQKLADDKDFLTIRFLDGKTAVAAGKNRIVRITFQ